MTPFENNVRAFEYHILNERNGRVFVHGISGPNLTGTYRDLSKPVWYDDGYHKLIKVEERFQEDECKLKIEAARRQLEITYLELNEWTNKLDNLISRRVNQLLD